ncbi:MAG: hypothetical protein ACFFCS_13900, partial [Candidatus Hodarchaeota archaeon]
MLEENFWDNFPSLMRGAYLLIFTFAIFTICLLFYNLLRKTSKKRSDLGTVGFSIFLISLVAFLTMLSIWINYPNLRVIEFLGSIL